jgi:hypothetical protein
MLKRSGSIKPCQSMIVSRAIADGVVHFLHRMILSKTSVFRSRTRVAVIGRRRSGSRRCAEELAKRGGAGRLPKVCGKFLVAQLP